MCVHAPRLIARLGDRWHRGTSRTRGAERDAHRRNRLRCDEPEKTRDVGAGRSGGQARRPASIQPTLAPAAHLRSTGRPSAAAQPPLAYAFLASETPAARRAGRRVGERWGGVRRERPEGFVALGGDGLMLRPLQAPLPLAIPVYG